MMNTDTFVVKGNDAIRYIEDFFIPVFKDEVKKEVLGKDIIRYTITLADKQRGREALIARDSKEGTN